LVNGFEVKFLGRRFSSNGLLGIGAKFLMLLFSGLHALAGPFVLSAANAQDALKTTQNTEQSSIMLVLLSISLILIVLLAGGLAFAIQVNLKNARIVAAQKRLTSDEEEDACLYQQSFDSADIGLVDLSVDGDIIIANGRFAAILGYSPAEIHTLRLRDVVHPDDLESISEMFGQLAAGEISNFEHELRYIRKDGTNIWVYLHASPIAKRDSATDYIVGVVEDITERRNEREELIKSREAAEGANRAKSEFLANMSHDLRTPLNSIIGFSDMIVSRIYGSSGDERYFEYADLVNQSGHRLLNLVNDLLDLSRIEAGEYELEEEWVDVIKELASAKLRCSPLLSDGLGITVDVDFSGNHAKLWADPQALSQIVDNLLSNAIKYAGENADVRLAWDVDEVGCGVLSVQDTGAGIERDKLKNIMKPFVRAHSAEPSNIEIARTTDGVGLGLHITSLLAGHHGAEVVFDSEFGVGTTVKVVFPSSRLQT
jgi:PAS domain S-box-containing protein